MRLLGTERNPEILRRNNLSSFRTIGTICGRRWNFGGHSANTVQKFGGIPNRLRKNRGWGGGDQREITGRKDFSESRRTIFQKGFPINSFRKVDVFEVVGKYH